MYSAWAPAKQLKNQGFVNTALQRAGKQETGYTVAGAVSEPSQNKTSQSKSPSTLYRRAMALLAGSPLSTPSFLELAAEYLKENTEILGPKG